MAPKDGEIEFNLAVAYDRSGQLAEAVAHYERALERLEAAMAAATGEQRQQPDQEQSKVDMIKRMLHNARVKLAAAAGAPQQQQPAAG